MLVWSLPNFLSTIFFKSCLRSWTKRWRALLLNSTLRSWSLKENKFQDSSKGMHHTCLPTGLSFALRSETIFVLTFDLLFVETSSSEPEISTSLLTMFPLPIWHSARNIPQQLKQSRWSRDIQTGCWNQPKLVLDFSSGAEDYMFNTCFRSPNRMRKEQNSSWSRLSRTKGARLSRHRYPLFGCHPDFWKWAPETGPPGLLISAFLLFFLLRMCSRKSGRFVNRCQHMLEW